MVATRALFSFLSDQLSLDKPLGGAIDRLAGRDAHLVVEVLSLKRVSLQEHRGGSGVCPAGRFQRQLWIFLKKTKNCLCLTLLWQLKLRVFE